MVADHQGGWYQTAMNAVALGDVGLRPKADPGWKSRLSILPPAEVSRSVYSITSSASASSVGGMFVSTGASVVITSGNSSGARILDRLLHLGWLKCVSDSRALQLTSSGKAGLSETFQIVIKNEGGLTCSITRPTTADSSG